MNLPIEYLVIRSVCCLGPCSDVKTGLNYNYVDHYKNSNLMCQRLGTKMKTPIIIRHRRTAK